MPSRELSGDDVLMAVGNILQDAFPHGHVGFTRILLEKIKLFSDKNHDYAKGGDPFGNFKRSAAILSLYPGLDLSDPVVVATVLMLKQLDAFLWGLSQKIEHKVEGPVSRLGDILVYSGIDILLLLEQQLMAQTKATVDDEMRG